MIEYIVFIGAFVSLILIIPYIKDTIKGNAKPNRVSWLLWSIAPIIGTIAAISQGVTWSVLPVFMAGFGPLLVFIASFVNKSSYWKLEKFDYLCGFFSVLALILWAITKNANIAILFSILSDFSAAIPTLKKSWKYPETEMVSAFIGGLFSSLTGFFAIKFWAFSEIAFLIYLVIINSCLIFSIKRKNIFKSKGL